MKNILIIEDHFEIQDNLKEYLELEGYKITTANNGEEGFNKALNGEPHLIICDVLMPILDGFGVLKCLKDSKELRHIPFIFTSSLSEKIDKSAALKLGADDYLVKPFEPSDLLKSIKALLKKPFFIQ